MNAFYTFLVRWEIPIYLVSIITLIIGVGRLIQARYRLGRAMYTLQREAAYERQGNAITLLFISTLALGGMWYFNQTVGPEVKEVLFTVPTPTLDPFSTPFASPSPIGEATETRDRPYVTPNLVATATLSSDIIEANTDPNEPTPLPRPPTRPPQEIFIPDQGGCTPAYAISSPRPNESIFGQIDLFGTATDPNFGYFGVEISGDGTGGNWISIFEQQVFNRVENDYLGTADFSLLPPGEYALKLSLFNTNTEIIGSCEISIELAEPLSEEELAETPAP
ncbi:MAG: hypothetical protein AAF633_02555 [Chloroflexota bacterium]